MKKNSKIFIAILVIVMTAALLLGLSGCKEDTGTTNPPSSPSSETVDEPSDVPNESDSEPTSESVPAAEVVTGANGFIDLSDIANYWIEVDGIRYAVMDPYSKFIANFENAQIETGIGDITLKPNQVITVNFLKSSGGYLVASVINFSQEDKLVKDCTVYKLSMDQFEAKKFDLSFIEGIKIDSTTRQEIETLFGEASEINETSSTVVLRYRPAERKNYDISYVFRFDKETKILKGVEMQYLDWPR
jgi:hypothetical protein